MTPFAQLEKPAKFGKLLKHVWDKGSWSALKDVTGKKTGGVVRRGLHGTAKAMAGRPGKIVGGYGLAGIGAEAMGKSLPGSDLALTASMPLVSAAFAAPGYIRSGRMLTEGNRDAMKQDMRTGAERAGNEFMTGVIGDPQLASVKGRYNERMRAEDSARADLADKYTYGEHKPMSRWEQVRAFFGGKPQSIVDNHIDGKIHAGINNPDLMKSGGWLKALTGIAAGAGVIGASTGKPYDEEAAKNKGFAAAQGQIGKHLDSMKPWQRTAAGVDPTLIHRQIEKKLPGQIERWRPHYQEATGKDYAPGFLSNLLNGDFMQAIRGKKNTQVGPQPASKGKMYEYNSAGGRYYLPD